MRSIQLERKFGYQFSPQNINLVFTLSYLNRFKLNHNAPLPHRYTKGMHSSSRDSSEEIVVSVRDGIAVVTLNIPKKLNALSLPLYKKLATTLQSLDAREDTFITLLTGSGRFFSAGADVQFRE